MASNGLLEFQGTNKAIFVGTNSNIVLDTVTSSLGIGVDVGGPTSNLHVVGNAYVSTDLTVAINTFHVDSTDGRVGVGTVSPDSSLHVKGDIIGRPISKTITVTKGTSLSSHVENFAFESDESRIVLNNTQGSVGSTRQYYANFITDVPTTIGTIIHLEINSSRTNTDSSGRGHKSEIQFSGVKVLSTGYHILGQGVSYNKTLKRSIILTSGGWEDFTQIKHGDDGNIGIGTTDPTGNLQIMSDLANASNQINPVAQLVLSSSLAGLDDDGDIGASLVFTQKWSDADPTSQGTMGSIHGFKDLTAGNYGGGLLIKTQPGSDTAPVERMRIDKDGRIKYNAQPRFSAYSNNGNTTYIGFTQPVVLNNTFYNVGSCYSTSTGAFTAPVSGHYRFSFVAYLTAGTGTQLSLWYRSSNSGNFDDVGPYKLLGGSAGGDETIFTAPLNYAAGCTFDVYVPANYEITFGARSASSITIYRAHTYFSGELISAA